MLPGDAFRVVLLTELAAMVLLAGQILFADVAATGKLLMLVASKFTTKLETTLLSTVRQPP
jgi:hypothetical protein